MWIVERWSAGKGGWIAVAVAAERPDDFLRRFAGFRAVADLPDVSVIIAQVDSRGDPVGDFHRSRGCCDGCDPSACHARQMAAETAAREAAKPKRENPRDEFEGTEEEK